MNSASVGLALLVLLSPATVLAQSPGRWEFIGKSEDFSYLLDLQSLVNRGTEAATWVQRNGPPDHTPSGARFDHVLSYDRFDCQQRTLEHEQFIQVDSSGKLVNFFYNHEREKKHVEAGSLNERLLARACRAPTYQFPKKPDAP